MIQEIKNNIKKHDFDNFIKLVFNNLVYNENTQSFACRLHKRFEFDEPKSKLEIQTIAYEELNKLCEELKTAQNDENTK